MLIFEHSISVKSAGNPFGGRLRKIEIKKVKESDSNFPYFIKMDLIFNDGMKMVRKNMNRNI
jgi:hypothetical protein